MVLALLIIFGLASTLPLLTLTKPGAALIKPLDTQARLFQHIVHGAFGVSMAAGLLIVLTQLATLITRNFFGVNFIWLQESALYLFGAMFLLSSGAVLLSDGHVRVDVFYSRLSEKRKALIDLFGLYLFIIPVCGLVILSSAPYVAQSWATLERSPEESGIHAVYLLKSMIPAFGSLLAMAAFIRANTLIKLFSTEAGGKE